VRGVTGCWQEREAKGAPRDAGRHHPLPPLPWRYPSASLGGMTDCKRIRLTLATQPPRTAASTADSSVVSRSIAVATNSFVARRSTRGNGRQHFGRRRLKHTETHYLPRGQHRERRHPASERSARVLGSRRFLRWSRRCVRRTPRSRPRCERIVPPKSPLFRQDCSAKTKYLAASPSWCVAACSGEKSLTRSRSTAWVGPGRRLPEG